MTSVIKWQLAQLGMSEPSERGVDDEFHVTSCDQMGSEATLLLRAKRPFYCERSDPFTASEVSLAISPSGHRALPVGEVMFVLST